MRATVTFSIACLALLLVQADLCSCDREVKGAAEATANGDVEVQSEVETEGEEKEESH